MNQQTWDEIERRGQADLVKAVFGQPKINPLIPNGRVQLASEEKVEDMPVEEFLTRAQRLAEAKAIREQLKRNHGKGF